MADLTERFFAEPDSDGEPTLWRHYLLTSPADDFEPESPHALLRRCDLPASARPWWNELVARVEAGQRVLDMRRRMGIRPDLPEITSASVWPPVQSSSATHSPVVSP